MNKEEYIELQLFSIDGYITTSKLLIKKLGALESLLLCELCSENRYWKNNKIDFDGWFPSTISNISENCGISKKQQIRIIKKLTEMGLIQTKNIGVPQIRHFKINMDIIKTLFNKFEEKPESTTQFTSINEKCQKGTFESSKENKDNPSKEYLLETKTAGDSKSAKKELLKVTKSSTNNNIYNNINNNNNNTSSYNSTCSIPTLEEVLNFAKCYVGKLYIDPENFYWQNERNGWIDHEGKPIKNWKGLFNTWNKLKQEEVLKQEKEKQLKHQKQAQKMKKIKEKEAISKKQYADYAIKHTQLECPHCGRKFPDKNVYYDAVNKEMVCKKCEIRWKATIDNEDSQQILKKVV